MDARWCLSATPPFIYQPAKPAAAPHTAEANGAARPAAAHTPPSMSASTDSSAGDGAAESSRDTPHVEAVFLIKFDKKVGCVGRAPSRRRHR